MSYLNTRQGLLKKLINAAIVDATEIAYEGISFNPSGIDVWVEISLIPVSDEILGKTGVSRNQREGIFQISVYTKKNDINLEIEQLSIIDDLIEEFSYNSKVTFNRQEITILESSVTAGRIVESWFVRDISINYLTFAMR